MSGETSSSREQIPSPEQEHLISEQIRFLNLRLDVLLTRMGVDDVEAEFRNLEFRKDVREHPDKYPDVCRTCYTDYNGCVCGAG
jgi:hypothetical protein